ncbi:transient receptor potential channel pyrexia-like [Hetaerina americana]|uniref:transient receptor potential channel pyrexia-like n=1 Tax=Hetaerina americana TaxID=62018 RepID=UPI003A7F2D4C
MDIPGTSRSSPSSRREVPAEPFSFVSISEDSGADTDSCESDSHETPEYIPAVLPEGSSDLHIKVLDNDPDAVRDLLNNNADVNARNFKGCPPLLYAGTTLMADDTDGIRKYEEVVAALVHSGADLSVVGEVSVRCRMCEQDRGSTRQNFRTTALLTAVALRSVLAVGALLRAGAELMQRASGITVTHLAASSGSKVLLQFVLDPNSGNRELLLNQINDRDANGCTPTHHAAESGSHDCVELLIKLGANLSIKNNSGISVIEAILVLIPRPKSFLLSVLDSCICGSQKIEPGKRGYIVRLDFRMLCPDRCKTQTDVLSAIFTSRHLPREMCRSIFKHPLVEAFVYYKWHNLRHFFLGILLVNLLFVLTLTAFVSMLFYYRVGKEVMVIGLIRYGHFIIALVVMPINIGQFVIRFGYYSRHYEALTHLLSAAMSVIWTIASIFQYYGIYCGVEAPHWMRNLLALQLPLAWAGLMLMLGRLNVVGSKATMFGFVLKNALLTFVVLGFIIVGFSMSFFIQFYDTSPEVFGNPWLSFANTLVMMTGEYGYMDLFGTEEKIENLPIVSRAIFLSFVLVATIVLMNLIIGLAVSDIQSLSDEGEWRCIKKKAESVDLLENLLPDIAYRGKLSRKVKIPVYGKPKDKGYDKTQVLPKITLKALVNVATREKARELARRSQIAEKISITFPHAPEGTLKHEVFNTIDVFMQQISHVLSLHSIETCADVEVPGIIRPKKNHLQTIARKVMEKKQRFRSNQTEDE